MEALEEVVLAERAQVGVGVLVEDAQGAGPLAVEVWGQEEADELVVETQEEGEGAVADEWVGVEQVLELLGVGLPWTAAAVVLIVQTMDVAEAVKEPLVASYVLHSVVVWQFLVHQG